MLQVSVYAVQLLFSGVGLALGAGMLAAGRDPAVFLPLVTSIIAYWLPAPRAAPLWTLAGGVTEAASSVRSAAVPAEPSGRSVDMAEKKPAPNDNVVVGEN